MARVIRIPQFQRSRLVSLSSWACVAAVLASSQVTIADDDAMPATAPPPPSLAPEAPPAPPSSKDGATAATLSPSSEDSGKSTASAESPEPTATPSPEVSDAPATEVTTVVAEPVPMESPSVEETRQENVASAKRQGRVQEYQTVRPAWAFELSGAAKALGGNDIEASQAGLPTRAVELQFEYQPPFLQAIGVLGFGPSAAVYPIGSTGDVTTSPASIWAVGAQARYQLRFFREQILVPMVSYEYQSLAYSFLDGKSGRVPLKGPSFGLMFLLNVIEPTSASEFYITDGVVRSYLVAEYKKLVAADDSINVSGSSIFVGLRLEF